MMKRGQAGLRLVPFLFASVFLWNEMSKFTLLIKLESL